ncbi:MAG: GerMN domain-containing protein [Tepidibacillus sp.]
MMIRNGMKWIIMFSMVAILLTGCGLYGPEEKTEIDPPPATLESQDTTGSTLEVTNVNPDQTSSSAENDQDMKTVKFTIYFLDEKGDVVPLTMDIPKVVGIGQEVLNYMIVDGPAAAMLPAGFKPVIPAGTKLSMKVVADQKLAKVDFSREFLNYEAESAADEKKILDAITWTLTEFPTVEQVEITVNGYPLTEMPKWKTPILGPLSRLDGINLELANNIQMGHTTPVTIYFQRTTADHEYLVPVTRLIPATEDIAKATIEQLILGPKSGTDLTSSLLPSTKVLDVKVSNNLVVADFSDDLLGFNQELSQKVIDMIVWSLTENTPAKSVQIKVQGKTETLKENQSKPIVRPIAINASLL